MDKLTISEAKELDYVGIPFHMIKDLTSEEANNLLNLAWLIYKNKITQENA